MKERLEEIEKQARREIASASSWDEVEKLRIKYISRRGLIAEEMSRIGSLPEAERPEAGRLANEVKKEVSRLINEARTKFPRKVRQVAARVKGEIVKDITIPGKRPPLGHLHPVTQINEEIIDVFSRLGFSVAEGPEVELEYYNFTALNIPRDHPSRDPYDTFYVNEGVLLRSHTSPGQIRVMEVAQPPIRVVIPGRTYRPDSVDATHHFMFHQIEGLMVDEDVSMADLKTVLSIFAREVFGSEVKTRFRPSFFPFTEPSADMDISCFLCQGRGCAVCGQTGWIEILGAGMVDPKVFEAVGYDTERYTGFAFGLGVERVAMLKFGIDDIRLFFENDLRFLKQF
jgi:phenylalanyl-tRNA synthetase alpha chain